MTDPTAYLDALPEAVRAEATARGALPHDNPRPGAPEELERLALALLTALPDETLAEVMDLVERGRDMHATKLMWEATEPRHPLRAAVHATAMFHSG